jgi:hypothetical protein
MRTSPSHLFFPFLQAVQARAPRFGMCDCICCCEDEPLCTVDMTCWLAPPVIRVSLRRFKDISALSLGSDAEEEKDIRRLLSASAECLQASPLSARRNGSELEFPARQTCRLPDALCSSEHVTTQQDFTLANVLILILDIQKLSKLRRLRPSRSRRARRPKCRRPITHFVIPERDNITLHAKTGERP